MRRSRYFGVALIGLLVVAAISVAAGSGRKPAKEPQGSVSLRRISVGEVVAIFNQFPEMLPGRYAAQRSDTGFIKDNFPFSEVTSAALKLAFPGARFYKGLDGKMPPRPYLMAIAGNNRYMMPGGFNRLLLASGQAVTDKSILELAEAFVYVAVGSEPIFVRPDMPLGLDTFPPVVFLEAKQTRQVINTVPYSAVLKVRIGAQTEEWYFAPLRGQLDVINRRNAEGLIKEYTPVAVEALPGHGQLYPTPNMVIDTFPTNGDAYLERDTANDPHYYVTVDSNGYATRKKVAFGLSGFPPNDTNVYVQVRDDIRGTVRWLHKVQMNGGSGSDSWEPKTDSTGICKASAGNVVGGIYQKATSDWELTPERVIYSTFPSADSETLKVYYWG